MEVLVVSCVRCIPVHSPILPATARQLVPVQADMEVRAVTGIHMGESESSNPVECVIITFFSFILKKPKKTLKKPKKT